MKRTDAWWRWPALWLALALAYFVAGRVCIETSVAFNNAAYMFYIPAGLSLTASLLWGGMVWPGVFLGELAATLSWGQPAGACLVMSCGNALDAALAGWWLHDRLGCRLELDRLDHVVRLLITELLVLQPLSALFGVAALAMMGRMQSMHVQLILPAWYASNVMAQLVIAPVVLAWLRWRRPAASRREYWELAALSLVTLVVGVAGSLRWGVHEWTLPLSLFFVVPLVVWSAVRFVPSVPLTFGSVISLFAFFSVFAFRGQLSQVDMRSLIFRVNVFMTVCLGTALFLAAAAGQQRRYEREQAGLIDELSEALNKVRKLQDVVTFCAWTGRVRWRDQWVSVEAFLRERYHLNISHGISEEALEALRKEMRDSKDGPPVQG
jgi:integral membrane sensor domain MASE1